MWSQVLPLFAGCLPDQRNSTEMLAISAYNETFITPKAPGIYKAINGNKTSPPGGNAQFCGNIVQIPIKNHF
ncbi:MAG: hypothetical protein BGO69_03115 [Bacteroidetes bacterium 46-16]|nr:MAG: hypothetical protein BGO69_03115 [Bacteroidetes bacterium 46-16]